MTPWHALGWRVIFFLLYATILGCSSKPSLEKQHAAVDRLWHEVLVPIQHVGAERVLPPPSSRRILLIFWATWCPACQKELFFLAHFFKHHPNIHQFLAVYFVALDDPQHVRDFLQSRQLADFSVWAMPTMSVFSYFPDLGDGVAAIPFSLLLSPAHSILSSHLGALSNTDDLYDFLRSAQPMNEENVLI